MAFVTSNPSQHLTQLYSITRCKCPWTLNNSFKFHFPSSHLTFSPPKHPLRQRRFSPLLIARTPELSTTVQEISNEIPNHSNNVQISSGFSQTGANDKRVGRKYKKKSVSSVEMENPEMNGAASDGDRGKRLDSNEEMGVFFEFSTLFLKSIRKYLERNLTGNVGSVESNRETDEKIGQGFDKQLGVDKRKKGGRKRKVNPEVMLKHGLDRCSKIGDFLGALILYDSARREGVKMDQSHYTILQYLCSSAATAGVRSAKSGGRSVSVLDPIGTVCSLNAEVAGKFMNSIYQWIHSGAMEMDYIWVQAEVGSKNFDRLFHLKDFVMEYNGKSIPEVEDGTTNIGIGDIKDSDNPKRLDIEVISTMIKKYALLRGFEICNRMCSNEIPMNEANLTSVARMCMALGDGDMAFFMVKQMKLRGINPRLRSYGPALSAFCTCGDVDKGTTNVGGWCISGRTRTGGSLKKMARPLWTF